MTPRLQGTTAAAAALALTAAAVVYLLLSPQGAPPLKCPVHELTGWQCPGCGSQRAFQALLRGDLRAAWTFNAALFFGLPLSVFFIIVEAGRARWPRLHRRVVNLPVILSAALAMILWALWRNLA